jgi:hypothetical protein
VIEGSASNGGSNSLGLATACNLNGVGLTAAHTTHAHNFCLKRQFHRPKTFLVVRIVHFYAEEEQETTASADVNLLKIFRE